MKVKFKNDHEETRLDNHYSLAILKNRRHKIFEMPMTFLFTHYLCNVDLVLICILKFQVQWCQNRKSIENWTTENESFIYINNVTIKSHVQNKRCHWYHCRNFKNAKINLFLWHHVFLLKYINPVCVTQ